MPIGGTCKGGTCMVTIACAPHACTHHCTCMVTIACAPPLHVHGHHGVLSIAEGKVFECTLPLQHDAQSHSKWYTMTHDESK